VQADSLSQVADELYALVPAEFTAARDEHAKQARAAGERQVAAEIRKLTRPTASAWLVNQLVRQAKDPMSRLFEIAQRLQDAQRELAGDRMRELAGDRRQIIAELLPVASSLATRAGQQASPAVLGEVRSTLEAALADPAAGEAVRSGRLTRGLTYAGLGEVDLTAAMAVLPSTRAPRAAEAGRPARPGRSQDAASSAAAEAEAASTAMAEAERKVTSIDEQRQFLRRRIEHMERELKQARTEDSQLARDGKQAQRDRDAAAKRLASAQRRLAQVTERGSSG